MSKSIIQDLAYRQFLMKYAEKYGVSHASRKYNKSRSYIYFLKQRWDGCAASLACRSKCPRSHPNQHSKAELKLIRDMRRRNPTLSMLELRHRLRQRGYTRCPESLFRVMQRLRMFPPEKPKKAYKAKPFKQMTHPGERVQVNVKVVQRKCITNPELRLFQYTAIDEFTRLRFLAAYPEQSTYSSADFLRKLTVWYARRGIKVECVQTDNGFEFTNRFSNSKRNLPTLFEKATAELGIRQKLIRPYTPRHNDNVADALPDIPQLEQDYPMPDPSVDFAQMYQFGYTDRNTMLPLSKERAKELFMQDVPVFMLYADSTEEMTLDMEDIEAHSGMYGIERNEWDMMRGIDPQAKLQDAEKRFLESPQDAYLIYQIKTDGAYCDFRFEGTEYLKQHGIEIDRSNYDAIYIGKLPADGDTGKHLNDLFYAFNLDRPANFQGHSLSVSDIVALKQDNVISCYYVDTVGFKEVPDFLQPENYLKNAEMAAEDDYGMIDGIINNGSRKTVAELEEQSKTGTPISLLELAQAVQREDEEKRRAQQPTSKEMPDKKPSILAKLKAQPAANTTSLKSVPKRSTEREL